MIDVGLKNSKNSSPIRKTQSHIEPQLMCTHGKTMYSNEVKFIKELHKWHDEKKETLLLP